MCHCFFVCVWGGVCEKSCEVESFCCSRVQCRPSALTACTSTCWAVLPVCFSCMHPVSTECTFQSVMSLPALSWWSTSRGHWGRGRGLGWWWLHCLVCSLFRAVGIWIGSEMFDLKPCLCFPLKFRKLWTNTSPLCQLNTQLCFQQEQERIYSEPHEWHSPGTWNKVALSGVIYQTRVTWTFNILRIKESLKSRHLGNTMENTSGRWFSKIGDVFAVGFTYYLVITLVFELWGACGLIRLHPYCERHVKQMQGWMIISNQSDG